MVRLKREKGAESHYVTPDGKWTVWREPYQSLRWYVNEKGADATDVAEGFRTKQEAVAYLDKRLSETKTTSVELFRLAAETGYKGRYAPPVFAPRVAEVSRLLAEAAQKLEQLENEGLKLQPDN